MKFRNIKKKPKSAESPSNYRIIPATFLRIYGLSLKVFIVFIFIMAAIVVGLDLQKNIKTKQNVDSQREVLTKELKFWENFIAKHQDYRDAYFKVSILEYKLGNTSEAKKYLEKGLSLDPNSENGKEIEDFLSKLDK